VDTDPPAWWEWQAIKPSVYAPLDDNTWLVTPKVQFGDAAGDDAVNINYALQQSPKVRLGPFTYNIATPIVMSSFNSLQGAGLQTVLQFAASAGSLTNMITNGSGSANACRISDLTLDGNKANNAGTWQCGIVLANPNVGPFFTDGRHQVSNVLIKNFTGDGFVQTGRGSSQFSDVQIFLCDGFGANIHEDCYYSGFDIGSSGIDGMIVQGGSNMIVNSKCWFSGAKLVSSRVDGATLLTVTPPGNFWDGSGIAGLTFSLANGFGNGFYYTNISGASQTGNNSGGSMAGCYSQDNARAGYFITGRKQTFSSINADSNNNCGTSGGVPNGSFAGVDAQCSTCEIQGFSWDRAANVNHQAAALNITSSANENEIHLGFTGTLNDGSNMAPLTAASVVNRANVVMSASGGFRAPGSGTPQTPDPFSADVVSITLTQNIVFNNPALAGTNTTGTFLVPGQRVTLALTQDGTGGRTVTLGGLYRLNGKAFTLVANATSVIEFVWDGTNWQAVG
jgi:hypothetical protein